MIATVTRIFAGGPLHGTTRAVRADDTTLEYRAMVPQPDTDDAYRTVYYLPVKWATRQPIPEDRAGSHRYAILEVMAVDGRTSDTEVLSAVLLASGRGIPGARGQDDTANVMDPGDWQAPDSPPWLDPPAG